MRGLVSLQALAALALFLRVDVVATTEAASEGLTEFLHSMSYQALNNENDDILLEFDWLTELRIGGCYLGSGKRGSLLVSKTVSFSFFFFLSF